MAEPKTTSRHSGLSPAMFPRAHTAWSTGGREIEEEEAKEWEAKNKKMREGLKNGEKSEGQWEK